MRIVKELPATNTHIHQTPIPRGFSVAARGSRLRRTLFCTPFLESRASDSHRKDRSEVLRRIAARQICQGWRLCHNLAAPLYEYVYDLCTLDQRIWPGS